MRAASSLAVSYPGVGRFRRAETGILGVEQTGGPGGPPIFLSQLQPEVEPQFEHL